MTTPSEKAEIIVLGSGVSGLTTALTLLENGYDARIIAREHFNDTVSANAAAVWFPYKALPVEKVVKWSNLSYTRFKELAEIPESGVSIVPFRIIESADETPFWLDALPKEADMSRNNITVLGSDFNSYSCSIPLIETHIYLPFLHDKFLENGGTIQYQEIKDIKSLAKQPPVINCTGLGSRELCNDKELYPIHGQTVKIKSTENTVGLAFDKFPDEPDNELAYFIPRSDCTILGGSAFKNVESKAIDEDLTQRIIERCLLLDPKLETEHIISSHVGLRPGRSQIRLEQDPEVSVIHNYGHGGAGFTVSWGCAAEVLTIVQKFFDNE
ncbi:MAG: FAD-dependent oxidoreductase [Balneola sp.]|nr:FAD-dependent oxidoreductase [Balneola sp.]MBO6652244.1 FAD-dependent oxidoreductase [Balneola sp.]MBO6710873.1 FAD-dependent oxidoreductase [Balneola sp.]MBO6799560.1 FAD-dependent oxidoreductase [Balneola sp.]MBO6870292.1 FAD-dependent oxidoreductase [Balneola sp.]